MESQIIIFVLVTSFLIISLVVGLMYVEYLHNQLTEEHITAEKVVRKIRNIHPEVVMDIPTEEVHLLKYKQLSERKKKVQEQISSEQSIERPSFDDSRGIVICYNKQPSSLWVLITLLSECGCSLRIEVWHKDGDISKTDQEMFNVTFRVSSQENMKHEAILNSSFQHVLYLDTNNNCLRDPEYLFDTDQYNEHGAIFWPDFWDMDREEQDIPSHILFSQQTSQMMIDRERCFDAISSVNSDLWMESFLQTNTDFYFIPFRALSVGQVSKDVFSMNTIGQKDPSGNPIFMYRVYNTWDSYQGYPTWTVILDAPTSSTTYIHKGSHVMVGRSVQYLPFRDYFGTFEEQCINVLNKSPSGTKTYRIKEHTSSSSRYPLI